VADTNGHSNGNGHPKQAKNRVSSRSGTAPPAEHQFKPGTSGNPHGRPSGTSLTAIIRSELAKPDRKHGTKADKLIAVAERQAMRGDFRFFKELIDRNDGKVPDHHEFSGTVDVNVLIKNVVARIIANPKAYAAAQMLADRLKNDD
jgi:hypothetical protein